MQLPVHRRRRCRRFCVVHALSHPTLTSSTASYEPPSDRWKTEADSVVVTQSKRALVEAMEQISDLRANFRLGKLLYYFKTLNDTAKGRAQLEKLQVTFHVTRAPYHRGVFFCHT